MSSSYIRHTTDWAKAVKGADNKYWHDTHNDDFHFCNVKGHEKLMSFLSYSYEAADGSHSKYRDDGCTCVTRTGPEDKVFSFTSNGDEKEINILREEWIKQYGMTKKNKEKQKPQHRDQLIQEFVSWVKLCIAVWERAEKIRQNIKGLHYNNNNKNNNHSSMQDESSDIVVFESDPLLLTHYQDVKERSRVKTTCQIYCLDHDSLGDLLPIRDPYRYKHCGICVIHVEESEQRIKRRADYIARKQNGNGSHFAQLIADGKLEPKDSYSQFRITEPTTTTTNNNNNNKYNASMNYTSNNLFNNNNNNNNTSNTNDDETIAAKVEMFKQQLLAQQVRERELDSKKPAPERIKNVKRTQTQVYPSYDSVDDSEVMSGVQLGINDYIGEEEEQTEQYNNNNNNNDDNDMKHCT